MIFERKVPTELLYNHITVNQSEEIECQEIKPMRYYFVFDKLAVL